MMSARKQRHPAEYCEFRNKREMSMLVPTEGYAPATIPLLIKYFNCNARKVTRFI